MLRDVNGRHRSARPLGQLLAMALLRLGIEVEWIKPREDAKPAY
jgi:hypothetical protein